MTSKSPVFPMPEPQQHYSDYGFDPHIDYFQVLEEARKHSKRECEVAGRDPLQDSEAHFQGRLQAPHSKNKKRGKWWRKALLFWKWKRTAGGDNGPDHLPAPAYSSPSYPSSPYTYPYRSVSGPVYVTESSSSSAGSWTPCRRSGGSRPNSGPLRMTEMGEVETPYLCLRDLTAMDAHRISASEAAAEVASAPPMPIYLVT